MQFPTSFLVPLSFLSSPSGAITNKHIGGHKANLKNPNTSEESKQHSREVLDEMGSETSPNASSDPVNIPTAGKNTGNVVGMFSRSFVRRVCMLPWLSSIPGGNKATLENPSLSEYAKEHVVRIGRILKEMGHK